MERCRRFDRPAAGASVERLESEGIPPTTAFISAFLILLREGLDALLVVAAVAVVFTGHGLRMFQEA